MEVNLQLQAPAALPLKESAPVTHWIGCLVDIRARLNAVEVIRKISALAWNQCLSCPPCSLATLLTKLPWLLLFGGHCK
jgi:hypothetical protein